MSAQGGDRRKRAVLTMTDGQRFYVPIDSSVTVDAYVTSLQTPSPWIVEDAGPGYSTTPLRRVLINTAHITSVEVIDR